MKMLRREIHPQVRVLDEKTGLIEYIASNETIDSYNEVIMASGWRFDDFEKNAPFVDSHNYNSIENLLGRVEDFRVSGKNLVETVKWAIDVPQNLLAQKGFAMTAAGYLKAVSVGFMPVRAVTKWSENKTDWQEALASVGMHEEDGVNCIYLEQQQKELSACVIGANPDAVARAYKAGILDDAWLEKISTEYARRKIADSTDGSAAVEKARQRMRTGFLVDLQTKIKSI
jgi:hypothetical protein